MFHVIPPCPPLFKCCSHQIILSEIKKIGWQQFSWFPSSTESRAVYQTCFSRAAKSGVGMGKNRLWGDVINKSSQTWIYKIWSDTLFCVKRPVFVYLSFASCCSICEKATTDNLNLSFTVRKHTNWIQFIKYIFYYTLATNTIKGIRFPQANFQFSNFSEMKIGSKKSIFIVNHKAFCK